MHAIEIADRLKCSHLQGGLFTVATLVGQRAETAGAGSAGCNYVAPWSAAINAPEVQYTLPYRPMTWSCVLLLILPGSDLQEWCIHTGICMLAPSLSSPVGKWMKVHVSPLLGHKVLFWAPSRTNSLLVILQSEDNVRLCHMPY